MYSFPLTWLLVASVGIFFVSLALLRCYCFCCFCCCCRYTSSIRACTPKHRRINSISFMFGVQIRRKYDIRDEISVALLFPSYILHSFIRRFVSLVCVCVCAYSSCLFRSEILRFSVIVSLYLFFYSVEIFTTRTTTTTHCSTGGYDARNIFFLFSLSRIRHLNLVMH